MPVRRGAYLRAVDVPADPYTARTLSFLARSVAASARTRTAHALSHTSAAVLWGLPVDLGDGRPHLTQATRPGGGHAADVVRHRRPAALATASDLAGLPVTDAEQTVLDCLVLLNPVEAMVVADSGLRAGVRRDVVSARLAGMAGPLRTRQARALLALADDGAESPGESRARATLLALGLPVPCTQVRVDTVDGPVWADLGWPEARTVAEYDGRDKYGGDAGAASALLKERRRQELIEEAGWRVLRLTAADLREPARLLERLRRRAPAGMVDRARPRAALAPTPWGRASSASRPADSPTR